MCSARPNQPTRSSTLWTGTDAATTTRSLDSDTVEDFVVRDWQLDANESDQAPHHIHHGGEEAFICIDGQLEVELDGVRHEVAEGSFIVVARGSVHTFATRTGAHVLAVMSPEIAELIDKLHTSTNEANRAAVWRQYHSSLA